MHPTEHQLNDYVDGILADSDLEHVRAHLLECETCARDVEQLLTLQARLGDLPHDITPARDLRAGMWQLIAETGLHTETETETGAETETVVDITAVRRSAIWSLRYRLATAAVVLIVASSAITFMLVQRGPGNHATPSPSPPPSPNRMVDSRSVERRYSEELREVEMVLRKSRGALAPETVRILEENLRIIDSAIREAKAALAADPQSDMLIDLLRSAYERKLELLRQAAKSSPVT